MRREDLLHMSTASFFSFGNQVMKKADIHVMLVPSDAAVCNSAQPAWKWLNDC